MKKKTKLLIRDSFLSTILSCILVLILLFTIKNITFFNPFVKALTDFNLYDIYYSENFKPNDKINTDIILVNIEHHQRDMLAPLIAHILEQDPKVIGLDVIFEEKKEAIFKRVALLWTTTAFFILSICSTKSNVLCSK